jgi:tryptophan synthase alpha chain
MRLDEQLDRLRARRELALVCYMTAGFPSLAESLRTLEQMAESGADVLEVGIPFSDPVADGPAIQRASGHALRNGTTLEAVLKEITGLRVSVPLVLMSYLNPLIAFGRRRLFASLRDAGFSGLIVPDLPIDEWHDWLPLCRDFAVPLIPMVAPTTRIERIRHVGKLAVPFVYCIRLAGTTGTRPIETDGVVSFLNRVRSAVSRPLMAGFGITGPDDVRALRGHADGVVIGSRLIEAIDKGEDVGKLVKSLKFATQRDE